MTRDEIKEIMLDADNDEELFNVFNYYRDQFTADEWSEIANELYDESDKIDWDIIDVYLDMEEE